MIGSLRLAHDLSIDEVDQKILSARSVLSRNILPFNHIVVSLIQSVPLYFQLNNNKLFVGSKFR